MYDIIKQRQDLQVNQYYVNSLTKLNKTIQMFKTQQITNPEKQKIQTYFTDKNQADLFLQQLQQIYEDQSASRFILSLTVEGSCLFIYFNYSRDGVDLEKEVEFQKYGAYCVKVNRGFPVWGLRVYMLNNGYQPKIFDSRDVSQEILGAKWTYKNKLVDILRNMNRIQVKLSLRNNNYLSMQKTGQFILSDSFEIHQLKKFSPLHLFPDISKQKGSIIATTQTHLLTFKQIESKQSKENKGVSSKMYQLIRVCQLQCISEIYINEKQQIIIAVNKYINIKSFNEFQKISRKYKFEDPHLFISNILKSIGKFQRTQISLQLKKFPSKSDPNTQKIAKLIVQSQKLQKNLQQTSQQEQKSQIQQKLIKNYHSIIEFFSERTTSYHLIYVNKLNKIYTGQSKSQ